MILYHLQTEDDIVSYRNITIKHTNVSWHLLPISLTQCIYSELHSFVTAFVGGSYLAISLSGGSNAEEERKRHDLAVEKYQAAYEKYEENRIKLLDWISANDRIKGNAKQNFANIDYALKLYNKVHSEKLNLEEPEFQNFYKTSSNQKQGELIYVGAGHWQLGKQQVILYKKMDKRISPRLSQKLSRIYYSLKGFWKGLSDVKKLPNAAKVSEDEAKLWLMKQAIWQIYLPVPKYIPRPKFDVEIPNAVHQADLLFLPHDKYRGKYISML